jgi:hypothetical protein
MLARREYQSTVEVEDSGIRTYGTLANPSTRLLMRHRSNLIRTGILTLELPSQSFPPESRPRARRRNLIGAGLQPVPIVFYGTQQRRCGAPKASYSFTSAAEAYHPQMVTRVEHETFPARATG